MVDKSSGAGGFGVEGASKRTVSVVASAELRCWHVHLHVTAATIDIELEWLGRSA